MLESGGGRPDASSIPQGQSEIDVRGGTLFRAEVCPLEAAFGEWGAWSGDVAEAVGEARRPTRIALLGREPVWRRSHHGYGMPRDRVLSLDAGPSADQIGL